jgi:hypothetical protein
MVKAMATSSSNRIYDRERAQILGFLLVAVGMSSLPRGWVRKASASSSCSVFITGRRGENRNQESETEKG